MVIKPLLFLELHPELITRENDDITDLWTFFENAGYRGKKLNGQAIELRELRDLQAITRVILEPLPV
jgi:hypothetical protein